MRKWWRKRVYQKGLSSTFSPSWTSDQGHKSPVPISSACHQSLLEPLMHARMHVHTHTLAYSLRSPWWMSPWQGTFPDGPSKKAPGACGVYSIRGYSSVSIRLFCNGDHDTEDDQFSFLGRDSGLYYAHNHYCWAITIHLSHLKCPVRGLHISSARE